MPLAGCRSFDEWITVVSGMLSLLMVSPAPAKLVNDFDRNLDLSRLRTFAFIGGFEQLSQDAAEP